LKKVCLVQPDLCPHGGGNAVAVWALEALLARFEVTVFSWEAPDWKRLDRHFGTHLAGAPIRAATPARAWRWLRHLPVKHKLLEAHLFMRLARQFLSDRRFDMVLSFHNEMALGRPSIQYVHLPDDYRFESGSWLLQAYRAFCLRLSGWTLAGNLANRTLVNSRWTGERFRMAYGGSSEVLYPPALAQARTSSQQPNFLCVGRFHPSKRFRTALEILRAVRARGYPVRLTLAGSREDAATLERLQRDKPDWVNLRVDLPRDEMDLLFARHRYALHCRIDEHYGIAIAEQVLTGLIPFAHRSGGQVEVVREDSLLYADELDAVEKICAVLASAPLQQELQGRLLADAERLGVGAFQTQLLRIVGD
jgi:glycosyltransferase involved in cell wall biosynthesis